MIYWLAYVGAMFCIALPAAWFSKNPAAVAVFATWGVGMTAYYIGLPEPQTQGVLYGLAFSYMCFQILFHPELWSWRCVGVAMLFMPLCVVCWIWVGDENADPWWTIYWLAWGQVALLIRPLEWFASFRAWASAPRQNDTDHYMLAAL